MKWTVITDHHNKYNNEKLSNIARITQMWGRHTKEANAFGKTALKDLFDMNVP